jgi:hypothetical protein
MESRRVKIQSDPEYAERIKAQSRKFRKRNRDIIHKKRLIYLKNNPAKVNQWYVTRLQRSKTLYKPTINAYRSKWRKQPGPKVIQACRRRLWHAVKGYYKKERFIDLLGCTSNHLVAHIQEHFVSGMSWDNYGSMWHIDHIRPCASFDLSDPEQQRACFHYTNLQPLWAKENIAKGRKWVA